MNESHHYDICPGRSEIEALKKDMHEQHEWQKDQNNKLSKLADAYSKLATCIEVDKAYRAGMTKGWKIAIGLVGAIASGGGIASLVQLFGG